jgi:hypothetical protein
MGPRRGGATCHQRREGSGAGFQPADVSASLWLARVTAGKRNGNLKGRGTAARRRLAPLFAVLGPSCARAVACG